ncbi:MAG TPA: hypothetical protein VN176_07050 [Verrucomicrobiae bacterium]|jgi:hypothetical protein|nr:hypothetical protein [Verrucomicrobiae bacterium]
MRKLLIRLSLVTCLAATVAGQTDEWKRYRNTDGNFSVLFPFAPAESTVADQDGMKSRSIQAVQKPSGYNVMYISMTQEQTVDEATFVGFRDNIFARWPQCSVFLDVAAFPVIPGYIGHRYRLNCGGEKTKLTITGNLYWGKHYAYAVLTLCNADLPEAPGTRKFLDSFSLIDAAK